jgi:hypothetical protein
MYACLSDNEILGYTPVVHHPNAQCGFLYCLAHGMPLRITLITIITLIIIIIHISHSLLDQPSKQHEIHRRSHWFTHLSLQATRSPHAHTHEFTCLAAYVSLVVYVTCLAAHFTWFCYLLTATLLSDSLTHSVPAPGTPVSAARFEPVKSMTWQNWTVYSVFLSEECPL